MYFMSDTILFMLSMCLNEKGQNTQFEMNLLFV